MTSDTPLAPPPPAEHPRPAGRATFGRVLVPLDGTPLAERAIPFAEAIAEATGARLVLLRVVAKGDRHSGRPALAAAGDYLEAIAGRLRGRGLLVATTVRRGERADAIVAEVRRRAIDLVVIVTHGRGLLGRGAGGSVAEWLLEHLTVPILLVRAWHDEDARRRFARGGPIVVPLDGSPLAEAALTVARAFAAAFGARLVLVLVAPPAPPWERREPAGPGPALAPPGREVALDYLRRVARELAADNLSSSVEVCSGDAAREIIAAAHRHEAAVVAIATHGQGGAAQMALGSVAYTILRDGCAPMALIRPASMLAVADPAERVSARRADLPAGGAGPPG